MDTEGRWLTYGELAAIRGTKRASAIKLAQRERWPRQAGNDRSQTVRVLVPGEWLVSARDQPAEAQDESGGMSRGFTNLLTEANKRADAAIALVDQTMAALADANARTDRAEAAIAGERQRADRIEAKAEAQATELRTHVNALQAQLRAAQAAMQGADELRGADDARRAMSRWGRLMQAWRGR